MESTRTEQRQPITLTESQRAFLDAPRFAVAATIGPDGLPHQTVVWYAIDGNTIVVSTTSGSVKHRHLERDPRLSLCIEEGFQYITLSGRAILETEPVAAKAVYGQLGERYASTAPRITGPLPPRIAKLLTADRVTIRLALERVQSNAV